MIAFFSVITKLFNSLLLLAHRKARGKQRTPGVMWSVIYSYIHLERPAEPAGEACFLK